MIFRVYGDNIIECIRVIDLIKTNTIAKVDLKLSFLSASSVIAKGTIDWKETEIVLVPGFDKSTKQRWKENILDNLKENGGLLDETPDAFISRISETDKESFICTIEFCSALQAGNQAWQRSGRAYSVGKTMIPYFYIIEYTKYELDSKTRERKALRDPNAIVPFSYLSYSKNINNPVFQTFFQSEEFDKNDDHFKGTDFKQIFSSETVANYIVALMLKLDTSAFEKELMAKTKNMVRFLSPDESNNKLTKSDIDEFDLDNFLESLEELTSFNASKKIAEKSLTGNIFELNDLFKKYSKGIFSQDLPFGVIPEDKISSFVDELKTIYTIDASFENLLKKQKNIIFTLIKGFKPRGDDNRPDRGILPLLRMTFGDDCFILTILYGPILKANYDLLYKNKITLADKNGLWQTIIYMSNALLIDSDILTNDPKKAFHAADFFDLSKEIFTNTGFKHNFDAVDITPIGFREDDVDTLIYMTFKYHGENTFIGLCNPPGGDWSGYSLKKDSSEYRWLSLPRVSEDDYKRPDHVIQFTNTDEILIIESKDNPDDLEKNIGERLEKYIRWLMAFVPSVKNDNGTWEKAVNKISSKNYKFITAGSYIIRDLRNRIDQLKDANVDLLFAFKPNNGKWDLILYSKKECEDFANKIIKIFIKEPIVENTTLVVSPT